MKALGNLALACRPRPSPILIVRSNNVDAGRVAVLRSCADADAQGFGDLNFVHNVFRLLVAHEIIVVRCFGGESNSAALDDAASHPCFDAWRELREDHAVYVQE
jgi:hypothetical protein